MIDSPYTVHKFYTLYVQYSRLDGVKRAEKFKELCISAYTSGGLCLLDSLLNKELKDDTDIMTKNIIRASIVHHSLRQ